MARKKTKGETLFLQTYPRLANRPTSAKLLAGFPYPKTLEHWVSIPCWAQTSRSRIVRAALNEVFPGAPMSIMSRRARNGGEQKPNKTKQCSTAHRHKAGNVWLGSTIRFRGLHTESNCACQNAASFQKKEALGSASAICGFPGSVGVMRAACPTQCISRAGAEIKTTQHDQRHVSTMQPAGVYENTKRCNLRKRNLRKRNSGFPGSVDGIRAVPQTTFSGLGKSKTTHNDQLHVFKIVDRQQRTTSPNGKEGQPSIHGPPH